MVVIVDQLLVVGRTGSSMPALIHSCTYIRTYIFVHTYVCVDSGVNGRLRFDGETYQLTLLNLPAVTECYKTYDEVNLVKSGDVGQVLVVGDLIPEEVTTGEMRDGITPSMRNARQRIFREPIEVSRETVQRVEDQLFSILDVCWYCLWSRCYTM